jgi:nucleoside-diphosphate-sugar epimerase
VADSFIFITGVTSPVGRAVVRRLASAGYRLCCLLRSSEGERAPFNESRLSIVRGDLIDPAPWESALDGAAAVVHLAPIGRVVPLAAASSRRGVGRFIALSSTRRFTRFDDAVARRVIDGEAALEASPLNFTVLRPTMMYGGAADANIHALARWFERRSWLPLIGGGRALVQPVHIDDVADAVARCLDRPELTARRALTLAGPHPMTWKAMAESVAASRGRRVHWIPLPARPALALVRSLAPYSLRAARLAAIIQRLGEDRAFDIEDAARLLGGWTPVDFRTGLERTYGSAV